MARGGSDDVEGPEGWARIFSGNPLAARNLAEALARAGVRTFEHQESGFAADLYASPSVTHVCVPPEDRERAHGVVTHWQTHHAARVHTLTGRLVLVVALSLIAPAALWVAAWALPDRIPVPSAEATGGVWLAGLVVVAQLESRRHRRERVEIGGPAPRG
jgi:hypothetical protein